tara:strand:- start:102 stop:671 length:570 start_codon:yes stop_codon:yes gene_type:complete
MYAKVEDNTVVKVNSSLASFNKSAPSWSADQLAANGIYEVVYNNTNLKDNRFYINGAESFTFANDTVTASYTAAVGKALDDVNATDENGVELDPVVVISGLKSNEKNQIKAEAAGLLQSTDWYVVRHAESATAIPANVSTYRTAVRTKSNEIETAIDGAATVEALEALFTYTKGADDVSSRPLGEWPTL